MNADRHNPVSPAGDNEWPSATVEQGAGLVPPFQGSDGFWGRISQGDALGYPVLRLWRLMRIAACTARKYAL